MRKIIGQKYVDSPDYLRFLIKQHYKSVSSFVAAVNEDSFCPNVKISESLVNSWLCGRRKVSMSSAALVLKVASLLSGDCCEDHYHCMCGIMLGSFVPEYSDDDSDQDSLF